MQINSLHPFVSELLDYARRRYPNRPLFWAPAASSSGSPPRLPAEGLHLSASRPVQPGRGLLVQLPGRAEGTTRTLLARVASTARRDDGSWMIRCQFAGVPVTA